jgi:SAM-dependent methyltransferase
MRRAARSAAAFPVAAELDPLTPAYEAMGVEGFYLAHGATYRNPHEDGVRGALTMAVATWTLDLSHVLDLACGSGEATLALRGLGADRIDGIDPFTGVAYEARVGQAAESVRFEDVAAGALAGRTWSTVVCSFALHLVETSRLPGLCRALAEVTDSLLVITPHKRPDIRSGWGWESPVECKFQRTRARLYRRVGAESHNLGGLSYDLDA